MSTLNEIFETVMTEVPVLFSQDGFIYPLMYFALKGEVSFDVIVHNEECFKSFIDFAKNNYDNIEGYVYTAQMIGLDELNDNKEDLSLKDDKIVFTDEVLNVKLGNIQDAIRNNVLMVTVTKVRKNALVENYIFPIIDVYKLGSPKLITNYQVLNKYATILDIAYKEQFKILDKKLA